MLAGHWLLHDLGILRPFAPILVVRLLAGVIAIDAEPMHDAAMRHLQFSNDWDVVLGLAGEHTGVAPSADIQIDTHSPLLRRVQRRVRV